jgi:hypothetical protein
VAISDDCKHPANALTTVNSAKAKLAGPRIAIAEDVRLTEHIGNIIE